MGGGGGWGSESALSSSQLWQGAQAWARLCCGAGRGWGRALTCHSASPGGRSPAPSPSRRRWSGKAQSPARKQKEAWVSPESRAEGESLPCVARAAERELKAGRAQPWLLQIARSSCHFCQGGRNLLLCTHHEVQPLLGSLLDSSQPKPDFRTAQTSPSAPSCSYKMDVDLLSPFPGPGSLKPNSLYLTSGQLPSPCCRSHNLLLELPVCFSSRIFPLSVAM